MTKLSAPRRVPSSLVDFTLVTLAVTVIAASAWPAGPDRVRVAVRVSAATGLPRLTMPDVDPSVEENSSERTSENSSERTSENSSERTSENSSEKNASNSDAMLVDLAPSDPALARVRNLITLWGRPQMTARYGVATWQREAAEFYAAKPIPGEVMSGGPATSDSAGTANKPNRDNGNSSAFAGEVVHARHEQLKAPELANAAGNRDPSIRLASRLAGLVRRNHGKAEPSGSQLFWSHQSRIAARAVAEAERSMQRRVASAGPVPVRIVGRVPAGLSFTGLMCGVLVGLFAACLYLEWKTRTPALTLATPEVDAASTHAAETESLAMTIPDGWVVLVQPAGVRARRLTLNLIVTVAVALALVGAAS